jgi:hypothetical protein
MARQWLTQGKQLQCPAHEMLVSAKPADGRRILNVHRSAGMLYIYIPFFFVLA